jgi:hypothetical protein
MGLKARFTPATDGRVGQDFAEPPLPLVPDPAEFIAAAKQAAPTRSTSIMRAHTAEKIISIITVHAVDQPAAVAVALALVSEAPRHPAELPSRR